MIHKFIHSSIFNSWFSNIVILFSFLIAIPIVITKLSVEEINVWFLFASIVALSQGVLFGFNGTFARFIAYSNSGIKISEFRDLKSKKKSQFNEIIDIYEVGRIFFLMKKVYIFLSIIYALIIFSVGYFALYKPIESLTVQNDGWIAAFIVALSTITTLTLGYYQVFLEGINKVALVQRTMGVVNMIGLLFILGVLFLHPTLVSIILVYQLVAMCATLSIVFFGKKEFKKLKIDKDVDRFDKELFLIVWESAWKSGITTIVANVVKHISAILVAQLFTPSASASFLFTKRIFDIIERFTMITFQARIPMIARYRGRGDFDLLMPYLKQTQYISYGVFLLGYTAILVGGDYILSLIKSNVELGNISLIILFSFATFLSRYGGMSLAIANQSNHVIEHINAIVGSVVFFVVVYLFYDYLSINVFPFAQIIAFLFVVYLFIKNVYPTIHTTFFEYEKKVLLPMLGILIFINSIYYWSNPPVSGYLSAQ